MLSAPALLALSAVSTSAISTSAVSNSTTYASAICNIAISNSAITTYLPSPSSPRVWKIIVCKTNIVQLLMGSNKQIWCFNGWLAIYGVLSQSRICQNLRFFGAKFFWPKMYLCYFYYFLHLCTNLIWREPAETNSEEGHEAEVECVEEWPGLDTRHKHSAAGDIAGEKVRLKERKKLRVKIK